MPMKKLAVLFLASVLVLSACSGGPLSSGSPGPVQSAAEATASPAPAPTGPPPDIGELVAGFSFEYPPLAALYPQDGERGYETVVNNPDITGGLITAYEAWA